MKLYEQVTEKDIEAGNRSVRHYHPDHDFRWITRDEALSLMASSERRTEKVEFHWNPGEFFDEEQILIDGKWTGFGETDLFDDVRHPRSEPPDHWEFCCGARIWDWSQRLYFVTAWSDH